MGDTAKIRPFRYGNIADACESQCFDTAALN